MRTLILLLAFMVSVQAEDWTVGAKTYHNVAVGQIDPDRVHITYDGGIGTVALADLTPELKKRFGYDPEKVKAIVTQRQDEARPDWEKISDSYLVDLIPKVKQETLSAATETERLHAQTDQNRLLIFHNIFSGQDIDPAKSAILHNWASCLIQDQVCVGMPKELVLLAWGNPDSDSTSTSGDGDDWETLNYGHFSSTVFLAGGIVKNITQTQTSDAGPLPRRQVTSIQSVGGG